MTADTPEKHYLEEELETLIRTDPEMFRFLREGSLDGIWYWDVENPDNEWMSPEMWRLFGVDPATKRHDPAEWQDLIFPEDLEVALDNFKKHCADPNHPYDQIVRYRHADGSTVWVRCRGIAIRNAEGKAVRLLGAHNDITSLKVAEENFRKQLAETLEARETARSALEANKDLRQFTYALSHDLKAPANTLRMLLADISTWLNEGKVEQAHKMIDLSRGTVDRMCSFIDSLLDYTQVLNRQPEVKEVSLGRLVEDIETDLKSDIEASGATLRVGDLPCLKGDPTQLRMLLQNLISNAIKFHRPGHPPVVEVLPQVSQDERMLAIAVKDNGIGIDARYQERIFGLFERLHSSEEYAGSGLGLAACQHIVERLGGKISLQSAPGKGSTFILTIPNSITPL
jgi:PAS domain S-box-containing protein